MSKKRNEVLKKFDELYGIIDKSKANPLNVKYSLDANFAQDMVKSIISNTIQNVVKSLKPIEEMEKHFDFFKVNKDDIQNIIFKVYRDTPSSFKRDANDNTNEKIIEIIDKENVPFNEKVNQIEAVLVNDPERLNKIHNSFDTTIGQIISLNFSSNTLEEAKEVYNSFVDRFGEELTAVDDAEFIHPIEYAKMTEIHAKANEINELKDLNKDNAEALKLLDKADEICQTAKSTSSINPAFENAGRFANEIGKQAAKKFFEEQKMIDLVEVTRQQINIKDEFETTNKPSGLNAVINNPITFDDKTKNALLDIVKILNEAPEEIDGSFRSLTRTRFDIEKAIDSKNMDSLKELVDKYETYDSVYSQITSKLNGLSENYMFPINMSAGRLDSVPEKYRNDVYSSSLIRGIVESYNTFKNNGINYEEFIENPIQATLKLASKYDKANPLTTYLKDNDVKTIFTDLLGKNGKTRDDFDKVGGGMTTNLSEALSTLSNLSADIGKGFASFYMINSCIGTDLPVYSLMYWNTNCPEKIKGIIALEPQDRNPKTFVEYGGINPETLQKYEKVDIDEYLRSDKTSLEGVLDRLIDAKETLPKMDNKFKKATKSAITSLLGSVKLAKANEFNKLTTKVVDLLEKNKLNKLSPTERNCLKAVANAKLDIKNKDTFINEKINKNMNALSAMKKDYKSRWFFQRWWGSETKCLDASIKEIENSIKATVGEEMFNSKLELAKKGELNDVMEVINPVVENNNRVNIEVKLDEEETDMENIKVDEASLDKYLDKDAEKQPE